VSLAASVIALSLGLYATHTMVPPTPGPIAAAGILKADLGLVILWGAPVSLIALAAGWLFAIKFAARVTINEDPQSETLETPGMTVHGPSAGRAIVPIFLPIVLIVAKSIADLPSHPLGEGEISQFLSFIGQPVVALLLGAFLAFLLPRKLNRQAFIPALLPVLLIALKWFVDLPSHPLGEGRMVVSIHFIGEPARALFLGVLLAVLFPRRFARDLLPTSGWVADGVMAAATIILITGSGGAFGKVLQSSGIADVVAGHLDKSTSLSIFLPFAIAAGLKTAQGSSTVAIITTAGIVAPLLSPLGLDAATARALTVVAIGAGSMVVSHANDSYFWVVTGFSKMTVKQGYTLQTLGTLIEGGTAAIALWVISLVVL